MNWIAFFGNAERRPPTIKVSHVKAPKTLDPCHLDSCGNLQSSPGDIAMRCANNALPAERVLSAVLTFSTAKTLSRS
jgi:hypothetical protein